jgi:hypothetical protein
MESRKRVLTSSGKVIDLDRNDGIESLPPESLAMEQHTYGFLHPQSFSVVFNGRIVDIECGQGQFYDSPLGARRLLMELQEMKLFPKMFPVRLEQNYINGDISCIIYMTVNGISHKVVFTYDHDHPENQISVSIDHPELDRSKMSGHWYADGRPCYLHIWNRSWTMLKTATQMRFWLEDYYNDSEYGRNYKSDIYRILRENQRTLDDMKRTQRLWRFW